MYAVCSVPTTEGVAMVTGGTVYTGGGGGGGLALFTSLFCTLFHPDDEAADRISGVNDFALVVQSERRAGERDERLMYTRRGRERKAQAADSIARIYTHIIILYIYIYIYIHNITHTFIHVYVHKYIHCIYLYIYIIHAAPVCAHHRTSSRCRTVVSPGGGGADSGASARGCYFPCANTRTSRHHRRRCNSVFSPTTTTVGGVYAL